MSEQPKKKGVKPGTKRGSYKKTTVNLSNDQSVNDTFARLNKDLSDQKEFNQKLVEEINGVTLENSRLKNQLNECEQMNVELQTAHSLVSPAFVFDPAEHKVFSAMNRVIAYEIKEGNYKRTDVNLPALFTANAIKYYIQNEFNHILK